jgi:hypothetical protein
VALPKSFIAFLRSAPYVPRSDRHSNALAEAIAVDLVADCPQLRQAAQAGNVVYELNFDLDYATTTWNVDLVLGRPPTGTGGPSAGPIRKEPPASVEVAIEIKGVMTEHRKNIKNRKRDLESHHQNVHNYNARTIAGGVLVLNAAPTFRSPLRAAGEITEHKNLSRTLAHCAAEVQAITVRSGETGAGLDAKALVVIEHDNQNLQSVDYSAQAPAPKVGSPMHYDAFIQRICAQWRSRFGS